MGKKLGYQFSKNDVLEKISHNKVTLLGDTNVMSAPILGRCQVCETLLNRSLSYYSSSIFSCSLCAINEYRNIELRMHQKRNYEARTYKALMRISPLTLTYQYAIVGKLKFDFAVFPRVPSFFHEFYPAYAIEVEEWHHIWDDEDAVKRKKIKEKFCLTHGIKLIVVPDAVAKLYISYSKTNQTLQQQYIIAVENSINAIESYIIANL